MADRKTQGKVTYIQRLLPMWNTPTWMDGGLWRNVVNRQMLALICRETLVSWATQLRWEVRARDPKKISEYEKEVEHYTMVFLAGGGLGYDIMLELFLKDVLDIPFGGMLEVVRDGERVQELCFVDGATLFPTVNEQYPVIQQVQGLPVEPIALTPEECCRVYLSPVTDINRSGWGMAPPERIYLALILLGRGDRWYANLLLDTPPPGILDLIDMSEESAADWAGSFRELMVGTDAFKIPVLYEHEQAATWIPFSGMPSEMTFNETTFKYAAIVCGGYGISVSDIGITSGRKTLAGEIRDERRSRRSGYGLLMSKLTYAFNRVLPDHLEWYFIQDDEETMLARGRARLANARAMTENVKAGILTKRQALEQQLEDGLITIRIAPEDMPDDEHGEQAGQDERGPQEHHILGKPIPPEQGGQGEVRPPDQGQRGPL